MQNKFNLDVFKGWWHQMACLYFHNELGRTSYSTKILSLASLYAIDPLNYSSFIFGHLMFRTSLMAPSGFGVTNLVLVASCLGTCTSACPRAGTCSLQISIPKLFPFYVCGEIKIICELKKFFVKWHQVAFILLFIKQFTVLI